MTSWQCDISVIGRVDRWMHCSCSKQGHVTITVIGAFCRCVPLLYRGTMPLTFQNLCLATSAKCGAGWTAPWCVCVCVCVCVCLCVYVCVFVCVCVCVGAVNTQKKTTKEHCPRTQKQVPILVLVQHRVTTQRAGGVARAEDIGCFWYYPHLRVR